MPSPVGHSIIGLALGLSRLLPGGLDWRGLARQLREQWRWLLLVIVLANAPDIDFLFGIYRNNLNFYHQTATHTLGWIALASLFIWMIVWRRRHDRAAGWFFFILALTGSHLLADMCCADNSPPYGIMLAWPVSDRYWLSPVTVFPAMAKNTWSDLWTMHNAGVMAVEAMITLPLVAVVLLWKQKPGLPSSAAARRKKINNRAS